MNITRREMIKGGIATTSLILGGGGYFVSYGNVHSSMLGMKGVVGGGGGGSNPFPYDAEVEYIESTGTQWIDTLVIAKENIIVESHFRLTTITEQPSPSGILSAYTSNVFYELGFGYINGNWSGCMMSASGVTSKIADTEWHDVIIDCTSRDKKMILDGEVLKTASSTRDISSLEGIALFVRRYSATGYQYSKAMIQTVSVSDKLTGEVLFSGKSVRFTNEIGKTEGAMYDTVSGQLFRNQGTSDFIIGPDK